MPLNTKQYRNNHARSPMRRLPKRQTWHSRAGVLQVARSYWVSGWWCASCHESRNKGAEQGFAAAACVVHKLEEAEVERQLVLRDAAVRAQPGAQQRPEALDGVDVDFAETITVLVARKLATGVANCLVPVAPGLSRDS